MSSYEKLVQSKSIVQGQSSNRQNRHPTILTSYSEDCYSLTIITIPDNISNTHRARSPRKLVLQAKDALMNTFNTQAAMQQSTPMGQFGYLPPHPQPCTSHQKSRLLPRLLTLPDWTQRSGLRQSRQSCAMPEKCLDGCSIQRGRSQRESLPEVPSSRRYALDSSDEVEV